MHHFKYQDKDLYCEDVPVADIAAKVGTPFFLYSHATLTRHFQAFDKAFEGVDHLICYSAKANTNGAILKHFANMGSGLDVVSGGELHRGLAAGVPAGKIAYAGVGKTQDEIDFALNSGIMMFNVESFEELEAINARAKALGKRAPISLRVNPNVDAKTHPYISTGMKKNKFGISKEEVFDTYKAAHALEATDVVGIDFHIGSQITQVGPFVEAMESVKSLAAEMKDAGIDIKYLDVGGGLGINYNDETPPEPDEYARAISKVIADFPITVVLEPGRAMVGNAGIMVTKMLYLKEGATKKFVIVDAGMNDLVRPSIYDAYQAIQPVHMREGEAITGDVVGPICESTDFLAKDREIGAVTSGDLLAVMSSGAYGFAMSSNYNSRPRACEVMVKGDAYEIIRERENYEDLMRGENIPTFL